MTKIENIIDRQLINAPTEVVYCKKCVVSNQRPRLTFNIEGICSACQFAYEKQHVIDWTDRKRQLQELCDKYRSKDGKYDVVIPCSGGKDSSMIAHRLKTEYGMHPLTVTWAPFLPTDVGKQNFEKFTAAGFTNILGTPNGQLHRKLTRIGFEAVGDPFLPFIYGQMAFPFHVAYNLGIKLIMYGENGEAEYGGISKNNYVPYMPFEDWADVYYKGVTVDDLVKWGLEKKILNPSDYTESDLTFYRPPPLQELGQKGIQMHWFSYYHKWIPQENYYYSTKHTGLQANPNGRSEGTYSKYASLDDKLDGLHYWMGFLKFGIGRATSDAAHEIRDGHITREEAILLVHKYDGEFPIRHFKECLDYMGITVEQFWVISEKYYLASPHLWSKVDGTWKLKVTVFREDELRQKKRGLIEI